MKLEANDFKVVFKKFLVCREMYLSTGCNEEKANQLAWEYVQPILENVVKEI